MFYRKKGDKEKMTGNNAMRVDELLCFIENEKAWDYYKFPAFYGDKYKSKDDNLDEEFLNAQLVSVHKIYRVLKYFDYKAQNVLLNEGLIKTLVQSIGYYEGFIRKGKPRVKDLINLCNFFLYLHEQNEKKFNIILKFATSSPCSILLACMDNYRRDRIAQFLMNEFLNSKKNRIFNIMAAFNSEVDMLKTEYPHNSIGFEAIFAIKKLNFFYNLVAVKDRKFKQFNIDDRSCLFCHFLCLNKIKYWPNSYKISLLKEKLKNNSKFRDKIIKTMTSYFKFIIGVDDKYNSIINPFNVLLDLGFKVRPYGLNKFKSYLVKKFFLRNNNDISYFCYILLEYFNKIFAYLIPKEARDIHNGEYPCVLRIFDNIFRECNYYEIFKFIAESPLKDEYPDEFYLEQFKAIDGMDKIF